MAGSTSMPIRGSDALPTDTLPISGAPSTEAPSYSITPRALPVWSSTRTPYPGLAVAGRAPSTPTIHNESERPTIPRYAGPATSRTTSRSGRFVGGVPSVWCGMLNWVRRAVGPASAAIPHGAACGRPSPQAVTIASGASQRRKGITADALMTSGKIISAALLDPGAESTVSLARRRPPALRAGGSPRGHFWLSSIRYALASTGSSRSREPIRVRARWP